jgi:prophage regulatory protein
MDPLLCVPQVLELLGVTRRTLDAMVLDGRFPPPLRVGPRLLRWERAVVEQWLAAQRAKAVSQ